MQCLLEIHIYYLNILINKRVPIHYNILKNKIIHVFLLLFLLLRYQQPRTAQNQGYGNQFWKSQNGNTENADFGGAMFKPMNKAPGELLRKPNWTRESLLPFKKDFYAPHVDTVSR